MTTCRSEDTTMSNEETSLVRQYGIIAPRTLDEVWSLAEKLAKSSLLPEALRNKVPEVMMQLMAGQELGLAPMASLRSFSIINGKPVMSADAMVAIVLGSGKAEYFRRVEESDERVTYATKRKGEPERRCTWTMDMAKKAALHQKENWRGYPRAMLASRAKSELARDVYSDVLAGVFSADEVDDDRRREPDAVDVEFVDVPAAAPPLTANLADYPEIDQMTEATTESALKECAAKFAARKISSGPAYDAATSRYKARVAWLKANPPTVDATPVDTYESAGASEAT